MTPWQDIEHIYSMASGSEHWHQHWSKRGYFTDGVKAVADKAGAYWLIDAIFSYDRKEEFQLWQLYVARQKGLLTMREDSDKDPLVVQKIKYTDFPEGVWKLYLENKVLMLPGER